MSAYSRLVAVVVVGIGVSAAACSSDPTGTGGSSARRAPTASVGANTPVASAPDLSHSIVQRGPRVDIAYPEKSLRVDQLPQPKEREGEADEYDHEVHRLPHPPSLTRQEDAVLQSAQPVVSMPVTLLNFLGQGETDSPGTITGTPPDTNGFVGPNHFVQTVNGGFEIWSKSGAVLAASKLTNLLFTGYVGTNAGNGCATNNNGDPVVLYDQLADRWFISQFSLPNTSKTGGPSFECIAVSQTPDPTGAYYLYDFKYPYAINDYPKFGVWPDAYYATYHGFNASYVGDDFCALDRAKMVAGQAATQQCFQQTAPNNPPCPAAQQFTAFGALPASLDGAIKPPVGSPGMFLQFDYTACNGPYTNLDMWTLKVDFTTPSNSKVTGPSVLTVAGFTPTCNASGTTHCIPEPGTTTTLDALDDRMMFRLSYRNFGTYDSLLANHSVAAGGGSGIRWYEIRSPLTGPTVFQQGTYAPADANWRWMGAIAQDQAGDMALGFSVSSSTMDPSIGWTGRLPGDTAGQMSQGETIIDTGTAIESDDYPPQGRGRWGDYSNMTVDPTDDCTFWYTQELFHKTGAGTWDTQIASVAFPGCGANDFSMAVSPSAQNLPQGAQVGYTVSTTLTKGTAETITLAVQDLPTGVTGAFTPPSVTAGTSSTLTLTATASAQIVSGDTFTVIGKATSVVHDATAQVTVLCTAAKTCTGGQNCGTQPDGCGGTLTCGTCTSPQTCGGGGVAGQCGCTPITSCPAGQNCGTAYDGCSGQLSCGLCTAPQTCGGGGKAGQCGCTPNKSCVGGQNCGTQSDGCSGTLTCGSCAAPQTCGGGGVAGVCGCTPATTCTGGQNCGTQPDGCGGNVTCGTCAAPQTCGGGGVANQCGCTPKTTCPAPQNCGTASDGCGGMIACGTCTAPQTCGASGVCGCNPITSCTGGQNCGTQADGCGGMLTCGTCTAPQTCGGGGTQGVCGCTPATSCSAGFQCGTESDGCGGTLTCGTCSSSQSCVNNKCVSSGTDGGTGSDGGSDGGGTKDAGADSGADAGKDAGSTNDAGTGKDAGTGTDSGTLADASSGNDSGSKPDSGSSMSDAAPAQDSSTEFDAAEDGGNGSGPSGQSGGCGCKTAQAKDQGPSSTLLAFGGVGLLGIVRLRRRRRAAVRSSR